MKRSSGCRQRPMACEQCGYHVGGTRAWWSRGLPTCPCGGQILPTKPADLAWCGIIGPEDMGQADWNAICRENGWPIVRNQGQAARTFTESVMSDRPHKTHCSYPGCGQWVANGAQFCHAGHSQDSSDVVELEPAMPF